MKIYMQMYFDLYMLLIQEVNIHIVILNGLKIDKLEDEKFIK